MATREELIDARTAAGARYAVALEEFQAALIEIAAYDRAFMSSMMPDLPDRLRPKGFHGMPPNLGAHWRHPVFADPKPFDWHDAVKARAERIVNSYQR